LIAHYKIPLTIIQGKNLEEEIRAKKVFPHPIYKDCIHTIINYPFNKYVKKQGAVAITGHHKKQRNGKSTMGFITYKKDITLINPLYAFDYPKSELMWEGYGQGFCRTACYCCPFQNEQQWEALKNIYPLLWNKMRELLLTCAVVALNDRPSEGVCVKNMKPYWEDRYGIKIKKSYVGKKKEINARS